jgi:hypothetical protein
MSGCYEYGNEPGRSLQDEELPSTVGQLRAWILPFLICSLKTNVADFFQTSVNFNVITRFNNPDDSDIHSHRRQNLEPRLRAVPFRYSPRTVRYWLTLSFLTQPQYRKEIKPDGSHRRYPKLNKAVIISRRSYHTYPPLRIRYIFKRVRRAFTATSQTSVACV